MRTYEDDEDQRHSDTEITLGTRSILGIFFGLALICGVFFGFGYSVGRGNTAKTLTAEPQQAIAPSADDTEPSSLVKTLVEGSTPPAPDTTAASGTDSSSDADDRAPAPRVATPASHPKPSASAPIVPPTNTAQATPAPIPSASPITSAANPASLPLQASDNPSGPIMVQIAAVSHKEDADVLVNALKKLGYSASVRSGTADSLLRVQIGPFTTRDEAKNMRAKLLNDGYNAIVK